LPAPILATRLANQHLSRQAPLSPPEIVAWFGAVQAQEYAPARWAIGQRAKGLTDADVARAFDAGEILRTHVMRATWHFVAPRDLRWMQRLTGPRVRAGSASVLRANAIDARLLARCRTVIARALEGGAFLTRTELATALERARIPARSQRLAYIVMDCELEGLICSGPRRGKQFTYALTDERAPQPSQAFDRDEALGELARRYFQSHGPATIRDYTWWSGLTVGDARRSVDIAGLTMRTEDGLEYWSTRENARASSAPASVHLLPIYDEYVNSYRDRALLVAGLEAYDNFTHYFIVDGRVAGTWRALAEGETTVDTRMRLSEAQSRAAVAAMRRYRAFIRNG
jgi:hypothetical protein